VGQNPVVQHEDRRRPRPEARGLSEGHQPSDGATYLIDPTLRKPYQTLRLRAVSDSRVAWRVDQTKLGVAERDSFMEWPLVPGRHTITATNTLGQNQSVRIFVK